MNYILAFVIFFPFLSGLLVYTAGRKSETGMAKAATVLAVVLMLAETAAVFSLAAGGAAYLTIPKICGQGLSFTRDGFRLIYACIAGLMWMMTTLLSGEYFAHHKKVARFYLFLFWTMGATLGVFLSADLFTTFIFFEIMSFTSYVWVAQEENVASLKAAETYLAVAVTGGLVMLMGLFMLYRTFGTLEIEALRSLAAASSERTVIYAAGLCMLFGFGAKAGAFPLHIWLPKAHPVAPAPASALLSGILTKTGIYGVLILSCQLFLHDGLWGTLILITGVITMFGGALLAVFSIDLKRTLACSSMSQIGFILVGIGMQGLLGEENALAVHGTLLHMMNHSMIKLVLFMAAGVVYMNTHALDLNKIRGFGRNKPLLKGIFLTGALAIGGIPLFGGYVSKTLLHEAIVEYGEELKATGEILLLSAGAVKAIEWIFLFSGGLTVAYMTKLYLAVFAEKNNSKELQKKYDDQKNYMNPLSTVALTVSAVVLLLWGLVPEFTMNPAAKLGQSFMNLEEYGKEVHYFSYGNLSGGVISVAIGACVYVLFIRKVLMDKYKDGRTEYKNAWPEWLDLEELLYRPLLLSVLPVFFGILCRIADSLVDGIVVLLRKTLYKDSPLPHERTEGNFFIVLLGNVLNGLQNIRRSLAGAIQSKKVQTRERKDYVAILIDWNETFKVNNKIISRSLSFGLMLFGIGLVLVFVYLIWL